MDDCRCSPLPQRPIPIVCAGQSDRGTKFAADYADFNFVATTGINEPTKIAGSVSRLVAATAVSGRQCGALVLTMIIADETDEAAMAKWEHYKSGTDYEALAWRDGQAANDKKADKDATVGRFAQTTAQKLPTSQGVLVGSFAHIAAMLDEMAAVPGVQGAMLTFDDFVVGMENFGTRIQPLMRSRPPGTRRLTQPEETAMTDEPTPGLPRRRLLTAASAAAGGRRRGRGRSGGFPTIWAQDDQGISS